MPDEWEVEKILAHHRKEESWQFLTRWVGYEEGEETWEPNGNFFHRFSHELVRYCAHKTLKVNLTGELQKSSFVFKRLAQFSEDRGRETGPSDVRHRGGVLVSRSSAPQFYPHCTCACFPTCAGTYTRVILLCVQTCAHVTLLGLPTSICFTCSQ